MFFIVGNNPACSTKITVLPDRISLRVERVRRRKGREHYVP